MPAKMKIKKPWPSVRVKETWEETENRENKSQYKETFI